MSVYVYIYIYIYHHIYIYISLRLTWSSRNVRPMVVKQHDLPSVALHDIVPGRFKLFHMGRKRQQMDLHLKYSGRKQTETIETSSQNIVHQLHNTKLYN